MTKFFAQLRPMERRLAVGVLVIFILVLNWLFIWPHFSDLSRLRDRIRIAEGKLAEFQTVIADRAKYDDLVKKYESAGSFVPPEDQAINFMRAVQTQAAASSVAIGNYSRPQTHQEQFFTEQVQGINVVATDAQLVDFLYKLGLSASMVRVRDLELQPDVPHQHLNVNMQLVASYQNKPPTAVPAAAPGAKPSPATSAPASKKPAAAPAPAASKPVLPPKPANTKSK
ncbi:MAG TPA: hypothetical protein VN625_03355 [Desulfuromonadaceae bacterium]|nr:hypothetical protein [Desulfuromonadaceae bacterium]